MRRHFSLRAVGLGAFVPDVVAPPLAAGANRIGAARCFCGRFTVLMVSHDIGEQMRNIARGMTPEEIDAANRYYAEHP